MTRNTRARKKGFTLVEILVTLTIVGVLAGMAFPVVVQQIDRWQALRAARDLAHLRTALESFHVNTRNHPLYLSHLGNAITSNDSAAAYHLASPEYTPLEVQRWLGPYIDAQLAQTLRIDDAFDTGYGAKILNDLYCYDASGNSVVDCTEGSWVAIRVEGMIGEQFEAVNDIVDGEGEPATPGPTGSRMTGRLRFLGGSGIDFSLTVGSLFYLAVPYTLP